MTTKSAILENPVKVAVGVILIVLFGLIAAFQMPMQLSPEVERPVISVSTSWRGASPQEMEKEIVNEQEEQLKSVPGVVRMLSESSDSSGSIELEFAVGTDMKEALLTVNSALQQVRDYPTDADRPRISTSSNNDRSIAWFILMLPHPHSGNWRILGVNILNSRMNWTMSAVPITPAQVFPRFAFANSWQRTPKPNPCCHPVST